MNHTGARNLVYCYCTTKLNNLGRCPHNCPERADPKKLRAQSTKRKANSKLEGRKWW